MSEKMHLISLLIHSPISYTSMTWMNKKDRQLKGLSSFEYWQSLARTIEKGCFDSVFFADVPVARGDQSTIATPAFAASSRVIELIDETSDGAVVGTYKPLPALR